MKILAAKLIRYLAERPDDIRR